MREPQIIVYTTEGKKVGHFQDAQLTEVGNHSYVFSGTFFEADGTVSSRLEFNPEVMPYVADITGFTKCNHKKLSRVYVQRGRQPVEMSGSCHSDD